MGTASAIFIKSATEPAHYPKEPLPELAFAGRSNVGKSSLINSLVGFKGLARTSNTPGRTQTINFYRLGDRLSIVDLPGYGFARVPEAIRRTWGPMVERYLEIRSTLKGVVLVLDVRRDLSPEDLQLLDWLQHYGIPAIPVLTKADKLSKSQALQRQRLIGAALNMPPGGEALLFSARTGQGRNILWKVIEDLCLALPPP